MAGFDFAGLSNALSETKGSGVSFESQAKKWETEAEGMLDKLIKKFEFQRIKLI